MGAVVAGRPLKSVKEIDGLDLEPQIKCESAAYWVI